MVINILEKEGKLEATWHEDDYTTCFDFALPVSGDYEIDLVMDEDVRFVDEYQRECSSQAEMKYSQGVLNIYIECDDKQSFILKVKDAERTYKASCCGGEDVAEQIETEGIEVYVVEDDNDEDNDDENNEKEDEE